MSDGPPPPPEQRIVQITGLREACCLRCGGHIKDVATMLADGRERCRECNSFSYVIPAPAANIAVVTQVTARELAYMAQNQMQPHAYLTMLGLANPFVALPVLKPAR